MWIFAAARGCAGWCCAPSRSSRRRSPTTPTRPSSATRWWFWLGRLPRRQRAALVLRYYEGLSDGEIAEAMNCAVGTVRAHISRALATLRENVTLKDLAQR